jgi:hypothetical protein
VSASLTSTTTSPAEPAPAPAPPTEHRRRWADGRLLSWGGPLAAVALSLRYTQRAWGPRAVAGDDVRAHMLRAQWAIDQLWHHGRLDGLLPTFAGGYQEFLFFGQGFTALVLIVRALTFGQLSTAGAMKVIAIGSLAAFPLAVAFLARSYGLSPRAAGAAALASLLVNNPFGVGLSAVFGSFLVPQQVAAILACLCMGAVLRLIVDPRPRWVVLTAVTAALILVTHIITALIVIALLALTIPTVVLTGLPGRRRADGAPSRWAGWRRAAAGLAVAAAVAVGLSAFWLLPFAAHLDLRGPVTTWLTPPLTSRLADIVAGRFLFRPWVAWIVLVGAAVALARVARRRRWALALITAPVGYVAVSRALMAAAPTNGMVKQLENRGIGLAAVIACFGLAAAVGAAARVAGGVIRPLLADGAALAAMVVLVAATSGPWITIAGSQPPPSPGLTGASQFLRTWLPPGARFAEIRQFPRDVIASGGVAHPDFYLAWATGHPTLNEFNAESTGARQVAFQAEQALSLPADYDAVLFARDGVTAVVSTNGAATRYLRQSPAFEPVWQGSGWTVLAIRPEAGHPEPATMVSTPGPATATRTSTDPQHVRVTVDTATPQTATLAVVWSPRWRARVDGRPVPIHRTWDDLVSLDAPAGRSAVALDWAPDPWSTVGVLLTLLTVVGLTAVGVRAVRGRRGVDVREPTPDAQHDEAPSGPSERVEPRGVRS